MVLPLVPLGLLAVPFMTKANTNQLLIAGGIAFLLWQKFGFDLGNVADKVNILPEAENFGEGLFNIDPGVYAEDQSGSPNPPPRTWWESPEEDDQLPIPTTLIPAPGQQTRVLGEPPQKFVIGPGAWAVPTPPVMEDVPNPLSPDRVAGQATNDWFTNPWFYGWFAGAEKLLESAAPKTNADRFR